MPKPLMRPALDWQAREIWASDPNGGLKLVERIDSPAGLSIQVSWRSSSHVEPHHELGYRHLSTSRGPLTPTPF